MSRDLDIVTITGGEYDNLMYAAEDLRGAEAKIERMQDALNWYAEMAKTMQRATLHVDNQVALHVMEQMALDGGQKARDALRPN